MYYYFDYPNKVQCRVHSPFVSIKKVQLTFHRKSIKSFWYRNIAYMGLLEQSIVLPYSCGGRIYVLLGQSQLECSVVKVYVSTRTVAFRPPTGRVMGEDT